jgi:uncharacterized protein YciI
MPFLFLSLLLAAQPFSPPGMKCEAKTIVLTEAGPEVAKLRDHMQAHFAYMAEQMKSGKVMAAGPMQSNPLAGVSIFNSLDKAEVEQISEKDPFVANGVLKITRVATWSHCVAAK